MVLPGLLDGAHVRRPDRVLGVYSGPVSVPVQERLPDAADVPGSEAVLVTELTIDGHKAAQLRRKIAEAENTRDAANLELSQHYRDGEQYFRVFTILVTQAARRRALIEVWELLAGETWKV